MAPAYLNYNINVDEGLANGTLVRLHSLSMETHEKQEYLNQIFEETPIGEQSIFQTHQNLVELGIVPRLQLRRPVEMK